MHRDAVLAQGRRGYIIIERADEALVSFGAPDILSIPMKDLIYIEEIERAGLIRFLEDRRDHLDRLDETEGVDEVSNLIEQVKDEKYLTPSGHIDRMDLLGYLYDQMQALQNDNNYNGSLEDGLLISEINSGRHDILPEGVKQQVGVCELKRGQKCQSYQDFGRCMYLLNQQDCPTYKPPEVEKAC